MKDPVILSNTSRLFATAASLSWQKIFRPDFELLLNQVTN